MLIEISMILNNIILVFDVGIICYCEGVGGVFVGGGGEGLILWEEGRICLFLGFSMIR